MQMLEFLYRWSPVGPWVLTAISQDRKKVETRTFFSDQFKELELWVDENSKLCNLYFQINPVMREKNSRPGREDILEMSWLFVDIDPRVGEDLQSEKQRILKQLTDDIPKNIPKPSCIISTGGGYHAFWKLRTPVPINGDIQLAEAAKLYNKKLELAFDADSCHNIDRMGRIPGSFNLPDANKIKKGRNSAAIVEVVYFEDISYDINEFEKAPIKQLEGLGFSNIHSFGIVPAPPLGGIEDLSEWDVPEKTKIIIVQGFHPDQVSKKDTSRSSWLFQAICGLIKCEVPEEVIMSVVLDPRFMISQSVLEKGSNSHKYALRQIERAKEETISPWLRILNEKHAVIGNYGGKCRVIEEIYDPVLEHHYISKQSFGDIMARYSNKMIEVGVKKNGEVMTMDIGRWWLANPLRRQFDSITFSPQKDIPNCFNLWRGFAFEPKKGDCSLFLNHTLENICGGDPVYYDYLIKWMARAIQKPASVGEVAIVLRGRKGTGKSIFAREFGKLFGRHFFHISNSSHLVGHFNAHLRDVVLLFADEAFYAGDKKGEAVLKTLITEKTMTIEAKGVDADISPNYVHLIMASNESHVIPASGDERRFFMLDVENMKQQDSAYFGAILDQMKDGGYEALIHHLMSIDITKFDVRKVPMTSALQEQKTLSHRPEEEWWFQKLNEARILPRDTEWSRFVRKQDLVDDYLDYCTKYSIRYKLSPTALGRFLIKVCPGITSVQRYLEVPCKDDDWGTTRARSYCWEFPKYSICAESWELQYGMKTEEMRTEENKSIEAEDIEADDRTERIGKTLDF